MNECSSFQLYVFTRIKTKKNPNGVLRVPVKQQKKALVEMEKALAKGKDAFISLGGRPDGYEPIFDRKYKDWQETMVRGKHGENTKYSRPGLFQSWLEEYATCEKK